MPMEQQLLNRITLEDRKALLEIRRLLSEAQQAWHRIDSGRRCELNAMHHEDSSLAYCLRWGMQAADELIELIQGLGKPI